MVIEEKCKILPMSLIIIIVFVVKFQKFSFWNCWFQLFQMKSLFSLIILLNLSAILAYQEVFSPFKQEKHNNLRDLSKVLNNGQTGEKEPNLNNSARTFEKDTSNINLPNVKTGHQDKTKNTDLNIKSKQETGNKTLLNSSKSQNNVSWTNEQQESGMLTKGMMLLLTISLFFMMFVAYKTYRRKSRYARIKKYGVRLTKGNVEMRPLPLDNEDEDETIFDLKNVPT